MMKGVTLTNTTVVGETVAMDTVIGENGVHDQVSVTDVMSTDDKRSDVNHISQGLSNVLPYNKLV